LTNQALQHNCLDPHVNRFRTNRSPSTHWHSRSRKSQQAIANREPTNVQR
jgi:hypothetical protein